MNEHGEGKMSGSVEQAPSGQAARRKFLRQTGRAAIAAPAVALLLSAGTRSAVAAIYTPPPS